LFALVNGRPHDVTWSYRYKRLRVNNKPYITLESQSDKNCYWKLVPHGANLYSIINKQGCDKKEEWCNALMSFEDVEKNGLASLTKIAGLMWEIHKSDKNGNLR